MELTTAGSELFTSTTQASTHVFLFIRFFAVRIRDAIKVYSDSIARDTFSGRGKSERYGKAEFYRHVFNVRLKFNFWQSAR